MFAILIVVAFLSGIAGLLALMSRLEPVDAPAVATAGSMQLDSDDAIIEPRAA